MREGKFTLFGRNRSVSDFRKITLGTIRCFKKLLAAKPFDVYEGDIRFFRRYSLCHNIEIVHWELFGVSKKLLAAKKLHGCEGDITFFRGISLYHNTKNFYWELSGVSEIFCYVKKYLDMTGSIANSINCFLIVAKKIIGKTSVFH